jgi:hypothetical protein
MAPGGAEAGPRGMLDGRADGAVTVPGTPREQPVTAKTSAATTTAIRRPGR